jgi:hypothetical protein
VVNSIDLQRPTPPKVGRLVNQLQKHLRVVITPNCTFRDRRRACWQHGLCHVRDPSTKYHIHAFIYMNNHR